MIIGISIPEDYAIGIYEGTIDFIAEGGNINIDVLINVIELVIEEQEEEFEGDLILGPFDWRINLDAEPSLEQPYVGKGLKISYIIPPVLVILFFIILYFFVWPKIKGEK